MILSISISGIDIDVDIAMIISYGKYGSDPVPLRVSFLETAFQFRQGCFDKFIAIESFKIFGPQKVGIYGYFTFSMKCDQFR